MSFGYQGSKFRPFEAVNNLNTPLNMSLQIHGGYFGKKVLCLNFSFVDQGFRSQLSSNRDEMEQQMGNLFLSKTPISENSNFKTWNL